MKIIIALLIVLMIALPAQAMDNTARAANSTKSDYFAPQEPVRKVQHSDVHFYVWEDGSWAMDVDGQFPYDTTGCFEWGICD
jgi:hypothetical protein